MSEILRTLIAVVVTWVVGGACVGGAGDEPPVELEPFPDEVERFEDIASRVVVAQLAYTAADTILGLREPVIDPRISEYDNADRLHEHLLDQLDGCGTAVLNNSRTGVLIDFNGTTGCVMPSGLELSGMANAQLSEELRLSVSFGTNFGIENVHNKSLLLFSLIGAPITEFLADGLLEGDDGRRYFNALDVTPGSVLVLNGVIMADVVFNQYEFTDVTFDPTQRDCYPSHGTVVARGVRVTFDAETPATGEVTIEVKDATDNFTRMFRRSMPPYGECPR